MYHGGGSSDSSDQKHHDSSGHGHCHGDSWEYDPYDENAHAHGGSQIRENLETKRILKKLFVKEDKYHKIKDAGGAFVKAYN